MTNEESKQEAIKKAYGEYWDKVKDHVDENGWCKYQLNEQGNLINGFNINSFIICEYNNFKQDNSKLIYFVRPLSLKGIENNNGWIRIESENDLPKDEIYYDLCNIKKTGYLPSESVYNLIKFYETGTITHYRPTILHNPPIF